MFSNLEKNENYQNSNYEDKDKIEDQYQDVDPVVQSCPHAADRRKPHTGFLPVTTVPCRNLAIMETHEKWLHKNT